MIPTLQIGGLGMRRRQIAGGGGGSSVTPIIWNSADKNSGISLDEADKRAYQVGGGVWRAVRSTTSFATGGVGDLMFEVERLGSANIMVGFMKAGASLADAKFVGSDANGWGYYASNGNVFNNNGVVATYATIGIGEKIRARINAAGDIEFFKVVAGVATSQGVPFTGLSGTFFPAVSVFDPGTTNGARAT